MTNSTLGTKVVQLVKDYLQRDYLRSNKERLGRVGVTDLVRCLRQAKYKLLGTTPTDIPPSVGALYDGRMHHELLQALFKFIFGEAVGHFEQEVVLPTGVKGHIDGLLLDGEEQVLLEFKTMNRAGWSKRGTPDPGYVEQANAYMGALGIERGLFVYRLKDYFEVDCYEVKFDPALYNQTIGKSGTVASTPLDGLAKYPRSEKGDIDWRCRYCPYLSECRP